MKKIIFALKLITIGIMGCLGILSIIMFPALIGSSDSETSIIG